MLLSSAIQSPWTQNIGQAMAGAAGAAPPPLHHKHIMKCQFACTTNIQGAEYGDKSPSSSLVNIYSIVATFSQISAGVIQTFRHTYQPV